ncbi:MAG TPA: UvrD-helicase domain-containing protein [Candidatus Andersenbacteria bacterium]|nr:UvrD-helicase domain-containing protein [Candidatus Andersenbacteria bacterium]
MRDLLADLNSEQQEVVTATQGPVLVLAGAGSGKTRTLTYRIAYILQQKLARPDEILALTFTNKAAGEMKERVKKLVGDTQGLPSSLGTFHSIGARLLREQARHLPRSPGFMICDADDSERLVRQALTALNVSRQEYSSRHMKALISRAKGEGLTPAEVGAMAQQHAEVVAAVYQAYEKLLATNDAYDFDDLLIQPLRLLQSNAAVRAHYQQRWRYISVDEYQDTNVIQANWLRLLAGPEENICVVGDDYQAIYSWRGARVENILQFEQTFSRCATFYLTRNYRSTQPILTVAGQVIAANTAQKHKQLWTTQEAGEAVQLVSLPSSRHEAVWVRHIVEAATGQGQRRGGITILYRTNAQSRAFEEEFLTHGIPYTIVGGWRFYERREIKDALAFLQFWVSGTALPLTRIAEALWRGIGPKTLARWEAMAAAMEQALSDILVQESTRRPAVGALMRSVAAARTQSFASVADLLIYLLTHSGYEAYLKAQVDGAERWENIEELFNVTAAYTDPQKFLEEVALLSDIDTLEEEHDRVTCMTLHASKGLEFETVIVTGCEEGLLPHLNSLKSQAQIEEERRLLYVGMTRAKRRLIITYAQTRWRGGTYEPQLPSRFLAEVGEQVEYIDTEFDQVLEGDLLPTPDIMRADRL